MPNRTSVCSETLSKNTTPSDSGIGVGVGVPLAAAGVGDGFGDAGAPGAALTPSTTSVKSRYVAKERVKPMVKSLAELMTNALVLLRPFHVNGLRIRSVTSLPECHSNSASVR